MASQIMTDTSHRLWIHPTKRRYYRLRIENDLFGKTFIVRTWGSLDRNISGMKIDAIESDNIADIVNMITARRKRRGYTPLDNQQLIV